jgi:ubiquinone/menaquinone biosynthesis C-methylase UbiE
VSTFSEYANPRIVALYDLLNPFAADTAYYLQLATDLSAASIIDVGCGTGLLACEFARRGHEVWGVDPSAAMLSVARHRRNGERVQWIQGDAGHVTGAEADLAVMTGHVAQVIPDERWDYTLASVHRALRPGGHLAFESRNPATQPWKAWTAQARRYVDHPDAGRVEVWRELVDIQCDRVRYQNHYRFHDSGEEFVSVNELRFPTQSELERSLRQAGFSVVNVFGDWDRQLVTARSKELIFVVSRP